MPHLSINLEAITRHLSTLADVQPCPHCDAAVALVVTDATQLLTELARFYDELAKARLKAANLRAAISAALRAEADGEPDPLAYLRWELPEQPTPGSADSAGGCA
jgi:hypothetical protein